MREIPCTEVREAIVVIHHVPITVYIPWKYLDLPANQVYGNCKVPFVDVVPRFYNNLVGEGGRGLRGIYESFPGAIYTGFTI